MTWSSTPVLTPVPAAPSWSESPAPQVEPAGGWVNVEFDRPAGFSATGSLTVATKPVLSYVASFEGEGAQGAATAPICRVAASFTSRDTSEYNVISGLSAWGGPYLTKAVLFSGTGDWTILHGVDGLTAQAVPEGSGTGPGGGEGTLVPALVQVYTITAPFTGDGMLAPLAVSSIDGLLAQWEQEYATADQMAGAGTLGLAWSQKYTFTKALTGHGVLSAVAWMYKLTAPGVASGHGVLTAQIAAKIGAALAGTGTLRGVVKAVRTAALPGHGVLRAKGAVQALVGTPISGHGALAATTTQKFAVGAVLSGHGVLAATVVPKIVTPVSGQGVLAATRVPKFARNAALAGVGALTATVKPKVTRSLSGTGVLSATVTGRSYPPYDDFNRADGSMGDNWVGRSNAMAILDNYAVAVTGAGLCSNTWAVPLHSDNFAVSALVTPHTGGSARLYGGSGAGSQVFLLLTDMDTISIVRTTDWDDTGYAVLATTSASINVDTFTFYRKPLGGGNWLYQVMQNGNPVLSYTDSGTITVDSAHRLVGLGGTAAASFYQIWSWSANDLVSLAPSGAGVLSGAARMYRIAKSVVLAGIGAVVATVKPKITRNLSGQGVLAAAARMYRIASSAVLSGSGALSATAKAKYAVALAGTGGLAPGDAMFANVVALLHMDGSNGGTTFIDESLLAANWTANNGAVLSTTQTKFGTASASFPNANSYPSPTAALSNFVMGTGDFTVECWAYATAYNGNYQALFFANTNLWFGTLNGYPVLWNGGNAILGGAQISTGAWHHYALSRNKGVSRIFVDGTQVGSDYTDATNYTASSVFIGNSTANQVWPGYIDEVRITKGIGRYAASFTAPTTPFSNNKPYAKYARSAALAGAGTLTATVKPKVTRALSGVGTLSATGRMYRIAAPAVLAGQGVLSATTAFPYFPPALTNITPAGGYSWAIPYWCHKFDAVVLGGGAGGTGGGASFVNGGGGYNGNWSYATLTRGTDIPWSTTSVTGSVGGGGAGGGCNLVPGGVGGSTSASATGWGGISGSGGGGQAGYNDTTGRGPGDLTWDGITYPGGWNVAGGGPGAYPGGGGGGGVGGFLSCAGGGGNGQNGTAWFYAYQTNYPPTPTGNLGGRGSLSATAGRVGKLTGQGTLTATAKPKYLRSAALSGAGVLSATVRMYRIAAPGALPGHGALTATAVAAYFPYTLPFAFGIVSSFPVTFAYTFTAALTELPYVLPFEAAPDVILPLSLPFPIGP